MTGSDRQLVLICGHQRSGTTLLQLLSDEHPEIRMTQEFGYFINIDSEFRVYRRWVFNRWRANYDRAMDRRRQSRFGHILKNFWTASLFLLRISTERTRWNGLESVRTGLEFIFPSVKVIGDKYPDYIYSLDTLAKKPGLKCVVIYRDARDVVSSTLHQVRTAWKGRPFTAKMDSAEKISYRWLEAIALMQAAEGRILSIRYEDLVRDPQGVLTSYAQYLGVEVDGFPANWISGHSIGKYRNRLSPAQVNRVLDLTGKKMEELGYDLTDRGAR